MVIQKLPALGDCFNNKFKKGLSDFFRVLYKSLGRKEMLPTSLCLLSEIKSALFLYVSPCALASLRRKSRGKQHPTFNRITTHLTLGPLKQWHLQS